MALPTSINRWRVITGYGDPRLRTALVPGTTRKITMRRGVLPIFLAFAADYHKTIAPIDKGTFDDWGYSYRIARASSSWSDHSSGTALDLNATKEGAQGPGNYDWWVGDKSAQMRKLDRRYEVLMWGGATALGGDYHQPRYWDWMHHAIRPGVTRADVRAVKKRLGIKRDGTRTKPPKHTDPEPDGPPKPLKVGDKGLQVRVLRRALGQKRGNRYTHRTARLVDQFVRKHPRLMPADGTCGPLTYKAITGKTLR